MKQIITLFFLLITIFMCGQNPLIGNYQHKVRFSSSFLSFKSDSMFSYEGSGCRSKGTGSGKFRINKDTLILNFADIDTANTAIAIEKIKCNNTDTFTLSFHVIDSRTKSPLEFAGIRISKGNKISNDFQTDIYGNTVIRCNRHKTDSIITLNVKYGMLKEITFNVPTDRCLSINLSLDTSNTTYYRSGTVWKYKIIRKRPRKLILRSLDKGNDKSKFKRNTKAIV